MARTLAPLTATGTSPPTQVPWGGRDCVLPDAHDNRYAQQIPGAQVQVFPAFGHLLQQEDAAGTVLGILRLSAK